MRHTQLWLLLVLFTLESMTVLTACNPVRIATNTVGLTEKGREAGEKLHLKVTPEQAITILDEVAAQNGWSVISVGDQYDVQGQRGKYFRIEANHFIGGVKQMSGVFFSESGGCFVVIGKTDSGIPEELVDPFLAAVNAHVGEGKQASKEP